MEWSPLPRVAPFERRSPLRHETRPRQQHERGAQDAAQYLGCADPCVLSDTEPNDNGRLTMLVGCGDPTQRCQGAIPSHPW